MVRLFFIIFFSLGNAPIANSFIAPAIGALVAGSELRKSVRKAEESATRLLEFGKDIGRQYLIEIDRITDARLSQIDSLAADRLDQVDEIIKDAIRDINKLESKIYSDLLSAIRSSECSINRTMNTALATAGGTLFRLTGGNSLAISVPPISPRERQFDKTFAFDTFNISSTVDSVSSFFSDRLAQARADTKTQSVRQTYLILSYINFTAVCFAPGAEKNFVDAHLYYAGLAQKLDSNFLRR